MKNQGEIPSPAKVNLFLEVCGRRTDGYHTIHTLMCCITLADRVRLKFDQAAISITCSHPAVPEDETNLACRAACLFFAHTGLGKGIHIDLEKNIPVGAGLGGGSSNAAAVLNALNGYYGHPVTPEDLQAMALSLGADVPFFIQGKPAVATGIGEILTNCDYIKSFPIVLVYPGVAVSTAEVYKNLNLTLTKKEKINTKNVFELKWDKNMATRLFNDLESTAAEICPEIQEAKASLLRHNALAALMSGSGSSVFGLYKNTQYARDAFNAISRHSKWQVFLSRLAA